MEVSGFENLHGFYGIIVLREDHHSVAMQSRHLFMHLHPLFGDTKYPVEKGGVARRKFRLGVIIPVKADREAMGVLPEHPNDSRRIPPVVVRDERDSRMKIVLFHEAEQGFEIQITIVPPQ